MLRAAPPFRLPLALLSLLLAAPLAPAARAQGADSFLPGDYRLSGRYSDGRATAVKLEVKRRSDGTLEVEREARLGSPPAGPSFTWRAAGVAAGPRGLRVVFRVAAGTSAGAAGALSGAAGAGQQNELAAEYLLSDDGRQLTEVIDNRTRLAPEAGWTRLETLGGRRLTGLSLGELARATLPPLFEALTQDLLGFGPTTLPHDAKTLRKQLGLVRSYLDLFVHAYPKGSGFDPWKRLRADLDAGYEIMGSFKDLYDVQGLADPAQATYDPAEVQARRDPVLRWQARFAAPSRLAFNAYYLAHAERQRLTDRKAKDLSPYFWGEAGIDPERDLDGLANLARLQRALLAGAREDLVETAQIDDIVPTEAQEHFHSFRKRLRTTVKLSESFPEVYRSGQDPAPLVTFLADVVDRYGQVNDKLVARTLAKERGQDARARRLKDEIEDDWKDLRRWQEREDVEHRVRDLRRLVRD